MSDTSDSPTNIDTIDIKNLDLNQKCSTKQEKRHFSISPDDIEETLSKGGGPGGQSINKSVNRVRLKHIPTGIIVSCQEFRDLTSNRKHAHTLLKQKVEYFLNGEDSKKGKKIDKIRKNKAKRKQRSRAKYSDSFLDSPLNSSKSGQVVVNEISDDAENDGDLDDARIFGGDIVLSSDDLDHERSKSY